MQVYTLSEAKLRLLLTFLDRDSHAWPVYLETDKAQPTVYTHLRLLFLRGFLDAKPQGHKIVYRLSPAGRKIAEGFRDLKPNKPVRSYRGRKRGAP